ncbi:DUF934 domain-containing protein [Shimia thalassica]|jgi:uncharacterized protein (DUF934 family)|uniref:DUF934 domain-containing protein n=1 Tax=Shimia thalassica TaxID=1715693 RepID=UPI002494FCB1|nr:DUF934 domain-containing protein [Shimia thalassica]MDO6480301.1 DUF934 domain-containing protein [Shimia thalassica]MDO6483362.1 DUF934 domain-containing protein [Shimia thalassica]MDO6521038.1 DUF934 domain-containing protein [Shimia thalassica]MDO6798539.1 DUF934 domain-containing protein [Shimia thalassica]MDP2494933.1 DUF934 domain-containing protein [Shimia thalassica]
MTVLVTDTGFGPETWDAGFTALDDAAAGTTSLDVASDTDPAVLLTQLDGVTMIRVDFPSFADGRGFTIARQLRLAGYNGRLRAKGHVISDQYAMARRCGFDEVEISDDLASRQPEQDWLFRADWQSHDYQARMRGAAAV